MSVKLLNKLSVQGVISLLENRTYIQSESMWLPPEQSAHYCKWAHLTYTVSTVTHRAHISVKITDDLSPPPAYVVPSGTMKTSPPYFLSF